MNESLDFRISGNIFDRVDENFKVGCGKLRCKDGRVHDADDHSANHNYTANYTER